MGKHLRRMYVFQRHDLLIIVQCFVSLMKNRGMERDYGESTFEQNRNKVIVLFIVKMQ